MKRSVHFMNSLGLIDWGTLSIGFSRGWVTRDDVYSYAIGKLKSENSDDIAAVACLASGNGLDDESIRGLLDRLAGERAEKDDIAIEKWRLAHLLDLDEMNLEWSEKVERLEEIGMEFGYPPDMRLCTRYGPSQESIDAGLASVDDLSTDPLDAMTQVIESLKRRLVVWILEERC